MSYVDQELTVEDMLADPIVQTLMRYDGISANDVRRTISRVRQNRPKTPSDAIKPRRYNEGHNRPSPRTNFVRPQETAA